MRDGMEPSLMSGMSSSHLVFDSRDELILSHVWLEGEKETVHSDVSEGKG
jgi:hypothetical protein